MGAECRNQPKVKYFCRCCGEEFWVHPSRAKRGNVHYCSISCATRYRNLHNNPSKKEEARKKISEHHADVSGERNPMFGRSGENAPGYVDGRSQYSGETYRKILMASGAPMRCELCKGERNIQVHHRDGNHRNNELSNLAFVCSKCHHTVVHQQERDRFGRYTGQGRLLGF